MHDVVVCTRKPAVSSRTFKSDRPAAAARLAENVTIYSLIVLFVWRTPFRRNRAAAAAKNAECATENEVTINLLN